MIVYAVQIIISAVNMSPPYSLNVGMNMASIQLVTRRYRANCIRLRFCFACCCSLLSSSFVSGA